MKKLLGLIAIMALGVTTTFAQTPAVKTTAPVKKVVKTEKKAAVVAANTTAAATKTKAETLKKDGTPDMRLKENKVKAVAKPVAPVKKDGTPDMRYKANKTAAKKAN